MIKKIQLKQDEFHKTRGFLAAVLNKTKSPKHKPLINKVYKVSWNKLDKLREILIYEMSIEELDIKTLRKFLNNVLIRVELEQSIEDDIKKYSITKFQLKREIARIDKKLKNFA